MKDGHLDTHKQILLGVNPAGRQVFLQARMANRHGLVAGATGTGKTVTLQVLAESFSRSGVPVFAADIKGDLCGLAEPGKPHPKIEARVAQVGLTDYQAAASPVVLWDIYRQSGHPVRTTVADMGPQLLSHLLELNETQEGVLYIAFSAARDDSLPLLDLKDLRSLLNWVSENAKELSARYGNVSATSIGAIQRRLLVLQESGGEQFFGEPALDICDLMRTDAAGHGVINLLDGRQLMLNPRIYATFLFWLMTELFEKLPEVGDLDKPRLVFFFDEAHLLFDNAPRSLLDRIEQVVRLIRSKGVGIYFVTQNPVDVPESVLGQLGNKVQHALRAFTAKEQKAVKMAADSFRSNPALNTGELLTQLGVGECLVSVLSDKGVPEPVEHVVMAPPRSRIGPAAPEVLQALRKASPMGVKYDHTLDSQSAHEMLQARKQTEAERTVKQAGSAAGTSGTTGRMDGAGGSRYPRGGASSRRQGFLETFFKSVLRSLGSQAGRDLIRALVRALTGGRR
jgi:DNA helicase HerA-like ATPase